MGDNQTGAQEQPFPATWKQPKAADSNPQIAAEKQGQGGHHLVPTGAVGGISPPTAMNQAVTLEALTTLLEMAEALITPLPWMWTS